MNKPKYSLIIPARNEADRIDATLQAVRSFLVDNNQLKDTEVVVVAVKERDDTLELAQAHAANFAYFQAINPGRPVGKGRDVRFGMRAANGEYRLFMDADLATPLRHINTAWSELESGADMVYGVRDLWSMHEGLGRKLMSLASNLLVQVVILPGIPDTQCGFKALNWERSKVVFDKQTILQWGFDIEILKTARIHKLKMSALAINDWHDPKLGNGLIGESNVSAMIKTLKELAKIRWQAWRGMYK